MKKIYSIATALTVMALFAAKAQTITTIAGNGTAGYNGDGIQATGAELNIPSDVAVDNNGNVYIADNVGNRIRKIDASGIITTVAGNGSASYSGDGGQATAAHVNRPWSVTVDKAGNVYIAEWGDSRVRKITVSTGIISTVAGNGIAGYSGDGGQATAAELDYVNGMCFDKQGDLYISSPDDGRIRRVDLSGIITTFAGTGVEGYNGNGIQATAAQLHNPSAVAVDSSNNIYIADYYNNEIRMVNMGTGIITCVAGNATMGYSGDGGQATAAELYYPTGVRTDQWGNIYLADLNNNRIRVVNAVSGIITTIAGNGTAGFSGDGGAATAAQLSTPWGVYITPTAFYTADWGNNRIRKISLPLGVNEVVNLLNVECYPNPVSESLSVTLDGGPGKNCFTLFNMLGQEVYRHYSSEKKVNVYVGNLPNGTYILKVQQDNGNVLTKKICISR